MCYNLICEVEIMPNVKKGDSVKKGQASVSVPFLLNLAITVKLLELKIMVSFY